MTPVRTIAVALLACAALLTPAPAAGGHHHHRTTSSAAPTPTPLPHEQPAAAPPEGIAGDHPKHAAKPHDGADGRAVVDSVYDAIGPAHAERPGYGRYTYVLLASARENERNRALIDAIVASTPAAALSMTPRQLLNVFEFLESDAFWKGPVPNAPSSEALLRTYDFAAAHDDLVRICAAANPPRLCAHAFAGPYLLTYDRAIGRTGPLVVPPYLIVDLGRLNSKAFDHVVAVMKQQVRTQDFAQGKLIDATSVALLSVVLDVSDWLPNLAGDVRDLVEKR